MLAANAWRWRELSKRAASPPVAHPSRARSKAAQLCGHGRTLRHPGRRGQGAHARGSGGVLKRCKATWRGKALSFQLLRSLQAGHLRTRPMWATSAWPRPPTCTSPRPSAAIPRRGWCTACSSSGWPAWASRLGDSLLRRKAWPPRLRTCSGSASEASFAERKAMEVEREVIDL